MVQFLSFKNNVAVLALMVARVTLKAAVISFCNERANVFNIGRFYSGLIKHSVPMIRYIIDGIQSKGSKISETKL